MSVLLSRTHKLLRIDEKGLADPAEALAIENLDEQHAGGHCGCRAGSLIAIPRSTVQISPRRASLTRRVLGFHPLKDGKALARCFVRESYIAGIGLHLDDLLAQLAPLTVRQPGQFFYNFGHAHTLLR